MHQSINLWLLVFTIMTVGVSHEKQQPNENGTNVNVAEIITQNTLATANEALENISTMTERSKAKESMATNIDSSNSTTTSAQNVSNISSPQTTTAYLENENSLRLNPTVQQTSVIMVTTTPATTIHHTTVTSSPSILPLELTTEKLSLTNKTSSDSLLQNVTNFSTASSLSKSSKQRGTSNTIGKSSGTGGIRVSGQKIEMPQLNNFFDHSVYLKNNEHGFRYGPHFETGNVTNITVQVGSTFYLHCRISLLQDKTVSWVRRNDNGLELLTVGKQRYSGDERYEPSFQYPNNWRLKITSAQKIDEATYECQISTSPPRFIHYNVKVNAPTIFIVDEYGISMHDKHYDVDSTIQLTCIVRHISMMSSVVYWIHNNISILNYDVTRGGISIKTDLMEIGANSSLCVAKVNATDAGNYTCSIGHGETLQQYTVLLHITNEQSPEAVHSGSKLSFTSLQHHYCILLLLIALLLSSSPNRVIILSTATFSLR